MIICRAHGLVYVATPKAATRSVKLWLERDLFCRGIQDHKRTLPVEIRRNVQDWLVWTTVRDPYDRAISAWWSTTMQPPDRYGHRARLEERFGRHDLESYVRWLVEGDPEYGWGGRGHYWSRPNQVEFLAGVRKHLSLILRVEALPDCLLKLAGICRRKIARFPRQNVSHGRPPREKLLTPEVIRLVNLWADPDFEAFGYKRIDPE